MENISAVEECAEKWGKIHHSGCGKNTGLTTWPDETIITIRTVVKDVSELGALLVSRLYITVSNSIFCRKSGRKIGQPRRTPG